MGTQVKAAPPVAELTDSPTVTTVVIAGRSFLQEELGIEQAANVADRFLSLINEAMESGAIDPKAIEAIDLENTATIWPVLAKVGRVLPQLLGELFAAVLIIPETNESLSDEDVLFVRRHLKVRQAMHMVVTFVAQNDLADVVTSFFASRDAVSKGLEGLSRKADVSATAPDTSPTEERSSPS